MSAADSLPDKIIKIIWFNPKKTKTFNKFRIGDLIK
jgi:hypothetical protein